MVDIISVSMVAKSTALSKRTWLQLKGKKKKEKKNKCRSYYRTIVLFYYF